MRCSPLLLLAATLAGCGGDDAADTDKLDDDTEEASDTDDASESESTSDTDVEEDGFAVDCEELEPLLITAATDTVDDWSGYWVCFQEENNCEGTGCSWDYDDLPEVVKSEDCDAAATQSCEVGGTTYAWCEQRASTGYVSLTCDGDTYSLQRNGLPDHTLENYASSETLPPIVGDSEQSDAVQELSALPVYNSDEDIAVFTGALGGTAVAANGVSIFNQFTGAATVAVTDETVDDCSGHPAESTYHYHAVPVCGQLLERFGSTATHSGLMGMAADGFPVFGPFGLADATDATGAVARMQSCWVLTDDCDTTDADCYVYDEDAYADGSCDLDPCNGRITAVPADMQGAFGETIYAYYMTVDALGEPAFPYLPYCYRGDAASDTPPPPM